MPFDSSNCLPNPRPSTSNRPSLERKVAFEEVEDEGSNLKIPDPMTQIQVKKLRFNWFISDLIPKKSEKFEFPKNVS